MTHRIYSTCAIVAALAFPVAALADISGTQTLSSGQQFSFSSGTVVTSGADVQWTGSALNYVGSAKGFDTPGNSSASYPGFTQAVIQLEAAAFTSAPMQSSSLVTGNVFIMQTNSGLFAKAMVTSNSGGSLTFQYTTFGASGGGGGGGNTPSITAVLDAGSYTTSIPEGGIFVVKGTNLSPTGVGTNGLLSGMYPLGTSLQNVSINFTPVAGGSATQAYMVYLYNASGVNQLAALLPSTVKTGNYQVTVTNSGATSSPASVQVVATKPGLVTQDSTGSGLAVVQNFISQSQLDINRFTSGTVNGATISPAHPGQTLIAWLTGMGPVPFADNTAPNGGSGYNFLSNGGNVQVFVGGTQITPFYAGRAPCCAGEDQIDFTLPTNIATGCDLEFHVVVNGVSSQSSFISVAPAGSSACVLPGYTSSQLQNLDNGGTITIGAFTVQQALESAAGQNFNFASTGGEFYQFSGFEIAGATQASTSPFSGCVVVQIPQPANGTIGSGTGVALDAGTVKITGPNNSGLSSTTLTDRNNVYSLSFSGVGATVNGNFVPGTYTLNGSGGKDVGSFSASINVPTIFTITNMPSTVNRNSGFTLNWTGGNSSDPVFITGSATNKVNGVDTGASFACLTTAGGGSFTVPASITSQLPAVTSGAESSGSGSGGIDVIWYVGGFTGSNFSAPLTAGGSVASNFTATDTTISGSVVFQ